MQKQSLAPWKLGLIVAVIATLAWCITVPFIVVFSYNHGFGPIMHVTMLVLSDIACVAATSFVGLRIRNRRTTHNGLAFVERRTP